ncbi:dihydrolipoamide acetyltransferase family protein [Bacillus alveayuensis]|uniref:dihydrolipoamide acetyltransferase family protein n=1 Tax=Aeribacillus alveayuensis TaxID=279215 RepID=UPI0005CD13BD|nr:dihydrolipoamide acetyltransferase family protein [Bacillus alveayuensis]
MSVAVVLPKLGLTMEEATLIKWHKEIGDKVELNEVLAEVETDKSTLEVEATSSGFLLDKLFQEGDTIPVSKVICHIGEEKVTLEDSINRKAKQLHADQLRNKEITTKRENQYSENTNNYNRYYGLRLSPAVRKKARMLGLTRDELKLIKGSGPRNRIVLKDLESFSSEQNQPLYENKQVSLNTQNHHHETTDTQKDKQGSLEIQNHDHHLIDNQKDKQVSIGAQINDVIPLNRIRSATARKLTASFRDVPQFIIKKKVDLSCISKIRNTLKSIGIKISLNDFFIQAAAKALEKNELVNAYFSESEDELKIIKNKEINIGLAVALENGLIVPVIKNANQLSLAEIVKKREELIQKAKSNRLSREDITGGTFTISNLGSFEVDEFTAIVNSPETAILAVGSTIKQPIVTQDDQIEIRPMLTMNASFDHRTLDGADAAKFMKDLVQIIESDDWRII